MTRQRVISMLFLVTISGAMLGGCASLGTVSKDGGERSVPKGDHVTLAAFYAEEAEKTRHKAEHYLDLASSYEKIHGAESELAQHYRALADLAMTEAEEDVSLSRLHRQMADEMYEVLRREMLPQP